MFFVCRQWKTSLSGSSSYAGNGNQTSLPGSCPYTGQGNQTSLRGCSSCAGNGNNKSLLGSSSYVGNSNPMMLFNEENEGDSGEPRNSLAKLNGHPAKVMSLDFHPKNIDLISLCDVTYEMRLWDINLRDDISPTCRLITKKMDICNSVENKLMPVPAAHNGMITGLVQTTATNMVASALAMTDL